MRPVASLAGVTLDGAHPSELAKFSQRLADGDIIFRSDRFVSLTVTGVGLAFQADPAYRAST